MKEGPNRNGDLLLNIGCGPIHAAGWVNVDGSNRAWLASKLPLIDRTLVFCKLIPPTEFSSETHHFNVLKGIPFNDNSVSAIYCGEVLEHFTKDDAIRFVKEVYRVLKPSGVFRVRVPDNYRFWKNYTTEFEATFLRPRREWTADHTRWIGMFFRDICVRRRRFVSYGHYHKWMYDEISLFALFEGAGFIQVERRKLHDSRIESVALVESHEDLTVEGIKPDFVSTALT